MESHPTKNCAAVMPLSTDGNNFTTLSINDITYSCNRDVHHLMVVNTLDINTMMGLVDNSDI